MSQTSIRQTASDGVVYVCADDIETAVGTATQPFQIAPLLPQTPTELRTREDLQGNTWMKREDVLHLLGWYAPTAPSNQLPGIGAVVRTLQVEKKQARAVAKKHRWMIAFRQKYVCATCNVLLHPKAFEIDHIKELRDNGTDTLNNLQALCSNCHSKKTRTR